MNFLAANVGHVRATGCEGRDAVGIGVEPGDREARLGEFDGQGEAHVALADDRDSRGVSRDATAERRGVILGAARHHGLPPGHSGHSTVTLLARFRGWSTSQPLNTPR